MPNGTALDLFRPHHPNRYFDVGIAEEHAVLFAAGMATKGYKPFCAIYSTFLQRAFDQIVHDVCLQNLPVVFCMDRGGLSGDDGPTHHGLFDISYLRCIPNLVHMVPTDEDELADMMFTALQHDGPIAIRYPRGNGPGVAVKAAARSHPDRQGRGPAATAPTSPSSPSAPCCPKRERLAAMLEARRPERRRHQPALRQAHRPRLRRALRPSAAACSSPLKTTSWPAASAPPSSKASTTRRSTRPVIRIGWPDQFIEHGKVEALRAKYGLTAEAALERAAPYLHTLLEARRPTVAAR